MPQKPPILTKAELGERFRAFRSRIREMIDEHHQFVMGVFPTKGSDLEFPFAYTIGNYEKGLPELIMIGLGHEDSMYLLNVMGDIMRKQGHAFRNGELVRPADFKLPLKVIDASIDVHRDWTCQIIPFYRAEGHALAKPVRVQQVVVCDPQGRFPGDPGCAEPYSLFPLLDDPSARPN